MITKEKKYKIAWIMIKNFLPDGGLGEFREISEDKVQDWAEDFRKQIYNLF